MSPPPPASLPEVYSALVLSRRCADAAVRARVAAEDACDPDARAVFEELAEFYDLLGAHAFLVAERPEPPRPRRPWWAFWRSWAT